MTSKFTLIFNLHPEDGIGYSKFLPFVAQVYLTAVFRPNRVAASCNK